MPNHITNRLTFYTRIDEVLNFMKSEKSEFDFENLKPMPEVLKTVAEGFTSIHGNRVERWIEKIFKRSEVELMTFPDRSEGTPDNIWVVQRSWNRLPDGEINMIRALTQEDTDKMGGYGGPHDFCCTEWGTKWNAYDINIKKSDNECVIHFNTAWSTPEPIFMALSEKFPDVEFTAAFADEDTGSNVGYINILDGSVSIDDLSNTKEGYELAFELNPGIGDYFRLNDDDEYEYHDPDDDEQTEESNDKD